MNFPHAVDYRNYVNYYNNEIQTSINPEIARNLQLAHSVVDYIKDAVPFSHNNHIRGQIFTNHHSKESFMVIADDLSKRFNAYKDDSDLNDVQEDWEMLAEDIVKLRVGACFELSIVGYSYGVKNLHLKNIEIFELENGDHDFLVLGRNPLSNPENHKEWGDTCVVCDPWIESCYPASQIPSKLHDYVGVFYHNGRALPDLIPFKPEYHSLNLLLSSIPTIGR